MKKKFELNCKFLVHLAMVFVTTVSITSCSGDDNSNPSEEGGDNDGSVVIEDDNFETTDWTTETHSNDADPNFDEIFDDTAVKRLDIVITEERWQSMLTNMTDIYGEFGTRITDRLFETDEDPIFVPAEIFYEDKEWYRVGVRFKGNSTLQNSWQNGILKLSFKLDFDEFENDYTQIENQRFYGFKKLSLKNNFDDQSFLREKVAADIFKNAGLVASHTAFYTVYVDNGNGPQYFGLYTLVEEVDDTVIETQYTDDNGNLYKPDGDAASFALGTYNEDEYEKKTNEDEANFSDVESLLSILHDDTRTTDPETWRLNLETVFDTDVFLKYLAVNTVIQNWDTYGRMTHNYFLYNNPDTNKLNWIPWDNNESLQTGSFRGSLVLDFSNLDTTQWPLIEYLYADPVYKAQYDSYLQEIIDNPFNESTIKSTYATYSTLIEPYATSEVEGYTFLNNSSDYQSAINELNEHVSERKAAVNSYLSN